MVEYKEIKKREFFEGVEVASFSARYPEISEKDIINSFLSELVSNSLKFFASEICERAKEEYTNDGSEKKRFYFKRYSYVLNIVAREGENDELCVMLEASLCRGRKEEITSFSDELIFDPEKQILKAPPRKKKIGASK